jgi:hypothetical protein
MIIRETQTGNENWGKEGGGGFELAAFESWYRGSRCVGLVISLKEQAVKRKRKSNYFQKTF